MTVKFPVVSIERATHIENYPFKFIKVISVTKLYDNNDIYDVVFEFPDYYGSEVVASDFFGCGVFFGLDLKYSSYGTEPERVR